MLDWAELYMMKKLKYDRKYAGVENYIPFPSFAFWLVTIKEDMRADAAEEKYNYTITGRCYAKD